MHRCMYARASVSKANQGLSYQLPRQEGTAGFRSYMALILLIGQRISQHVHHLRASIWPQATRIGKQWLQHLSCCTAVLEYPEIGYATCKQWQIDIRPCIQVGMVAMSLAECMRPANMGSLFFSLLSSFPLVPWHDSLTITLPPCQQEQCTSVITLNRLPVIKYTSPSFYPTYPQVVTPVSNEAIASTSWLSC
jgi:hypothetical protein